MCTMGPANVLFEALPAAGLWLFSRPNRMFWSAVEAGPWLWLLLGVVLGTVEAPSVGAGFAGWVIVDDFRLFQMASTREPPATSATRPETRDSASMRKKVWRSDKIERDRLAHTRGMHGDREKLPAKRKT